VASLPSTLERLYFTAASGDARHLSQVAIIDLRGNQNPNGDIHANWRSWSMRERLDKANGTHANQVIWASTPGLAPGAALARKAFLTMDAWLAAVEADSSTRTRPQKVIANRPSDPSDLCFATTGATDDQIQPEDNLGLGTAQRARLQAVFPSGVCDWSKPGVAQQTSPGWVTFSGPTPQALPPAPTSQP
jgi:hypothetical protein